MLSASSSPVLFWKRPYVDLGPSNGGPLHVYGLELAWRAFNDECLPPYALQVHLPASFRVDLLRETGMTQYRPNRRDAAMRRYKGCSEPTELPFSLLALALCGENGHQHRILNR